jgi:hypothetical protein
MPANAGTGTKNPKKAASLPPASKRHVQIETRYAPPVAATMLIPANTIRSPTSAQQSSFLGKEFFVGVLWCGCPLGPCNRTV